MCVYMLVPKWLYPLPRREKEPLRRWGKISGKGRWGEEEDNFILVSLSSLIVIGCQNNRAAWGEVNKF